MIIRRIITASVTIFLLSASLFISLSTVIFSATEVVAESRYVIPSAEVVLRSGAGREYKVISVVKDGDSVDFLKADGPYALVRLANGKEGWMLHRYLSTDPPLAEVVASLRAENEQLKQKELELTQKLNELSANLSKSETELNSIVSQKKQISENYNILQQDTADVIKIKEGRLQAVQQNEILTEEIAALQVENDRLNKDKSISWFMAGGGVLLAGVFLGRLLNTSRRRKPSLI